MRNWLFRIHRAPDGEGGSGAVAGGGDGGASTVAGGEAGAGTSGADTVAGGGSGEAPQLYRPDGLAEQYRGESDTQTIDKLMAAIAERSADVPRTSPPIASMANLGGVKPYYATLEQDACSMRSHRRRRISGLARRSCKGSCTPI